MLFKIVFMLALMIVSSATNVLGQEINGNNSIFETTYEDRPGAQLRWLDKATARTGTIDLARDETVQFDQISVRLKSCKAQDPIEGGDAAAFLQIWERRDNRDPIWIFSGWMYASNPGVAAMDHPVLDVWLLSCHNQPLPQESDGSDETDGQVSDSDETP